VNQKGGSGKTTTSANLAATLREKGRRVLVVDMHPQASASKGYGVREAGHDLLEVSRTTGIWPASSGRRKRRGYP